MDKNFNSHHFSNNLFSYHSKHTLSTCNRLFLVENYIFLIKLANLQKLLYLCAHYQHLIIYEKFQT